MKSINVLDDSGSKNWVGFQMSNASFMNMARSKTAVHPPRNFP